MRAFLFRSFMLAITLDIPMEPTVALHETSWRTSKSYSDQSRAQSPGETAKLLE